MQTGAVLRAPKGACGAPVRKPWPAAHPGPMYLASYDLVGYYRAQYRLLQGVRMGGMHAWREPMTASQHCAQLRSACSTQLQ